MVPPRHHFTHGFNRSFQHDVAFFFFFFLLTVFSQSCCLCTRQILWGTSCMVDFYFFIFSGLGGELADYLYSREL